MKRSNTKRRNQPERDLFESVVDSLPQTQIIKRVAALGVVPNLRRPSSSKKAIRPGKGKKNPGKGAFKRCVAAVASKGTAADPRAVCASVARKKYGQAELSRMAAAGRRAAARARSNKGRRRNPEESAAERYEFFHGHPPETDTTIERTEHRHDVTSGIGKLVSLKIAAVNGSKVITLGDFRGALLSQDEKGTTLFIKGGDQKVDLKDFGIVPPYHELEVLGAAVEVGYYTKKSHLRPEDGGQAVYEHKFGSHRSRLPIMLYDVPNKQILFAGGGYTLPAEGIDG